MSLYDNGSVMMTMMQLQGESLIEEDTNNHNKANESRNLRNQLEAKKLERMRING